MLKFEKQDPAFVMMPDLSFDPDREPAFLHDGRRVFSGFSYRFSSTRRGLMEVSLLFLKTRNMTDSISQFCPRHMVCVFSGNDPKERF